MLFRSPFLDLSLQHRALREPALAALAATYDATRFCLGKDVEDFEKNFSSKLGYPRALALNSGTSPLHIACMIAGFGAGDEVIAPPFTFISTVWGVSYVGATPRFVDVEEGTFNLDPAQLKALLSPRTKAVIAVDQFGLAADLDPITNFCKEHGLPLIEDAACALGAEYKGKKIGSFGEMVIFSFHPRKSISTGEGGALTTNRPEWAERARVLRAHGKIGRAHV